MALIDRDKIIDLLISLAHPNMPTMEDPGECGCDMCNALGTAVVEVRALPDDGEGKCCCASDSKGYECTLRPGHSGLHEAHGSIPLRTWLTPAPTASEGCKTCMEIRRNHGGVFSEGCEAEAGECSVCSILDCPEQDPLHYHHDGCPSCSTNPVHADRSETLPVGGERCKGTGFVPVGVERDDHVRRSGTAQVTAMGPLSTGAAPSVCPTCGGTLRRLDDHSIICPDCAPRCECPMCGTTFQASAHLCNGHASPTSGESVEDDAASIVLPLNDAEIAKLREEIDRANAHYESVRLDCIAREEEAAKLREDVERMGALAVTGRDALAAIFKLMDDGWLVRDNKQDHEDGWAIKQVNPLRQLSDAKRAHDSLTAALASHKADGGKP